MTLKILSRIQLAELLPYSLSHIARLEKAGRFPKRIKLGANRVGWLESEIDDWLNQRISQRDGGRI